MGISIYFGSRSLILSEGNFSVSNNKHYLHLLSRLNSGTSQIRKTFAFFSVDKPGKKPQIFDPTDAARSTTAIKNFDIPVSRKLSLMLIPCTLYLDIFICEK